MIRVAQIISSRDYGGAEQQFCALSRMLDGRRFEVFGICPPDARYVPTSGARPAG